MDAGYSSFSFWTLVLKTHGVRMTTLLLLATLSCPKTEIVNTTKFPWNDFDQQNLEYAQKRCSEIYPDAPCAKLFKKYGEQDYSVICGAKQ